MNYAPYHTPVLVEEVIDALHIEKGKKYIDATCGAGGHSREIVKRGGILLGIDVDPEGVAQAKETFNILAQTKREGIDWRIVQGNFGDIEKIGKEQGFTSVSGILFDLGVSSHQLDSASRGFSYRFNAQLDLRFNQNIGQPASKIVQTYSEGELYEVFAKFGEEERARSIAHAFVSTRNIKKIITTFDIKEIVAKIIKNHDRQNATLSRIFQALRIEVNDERENLKKGLSGAFQLLEQRGILVVISFHSGEDRIVKQFMNTNAYHIKTIKPIVASQSEIMGNVRSRSAKMRVAMKKF